MKEQRQKIVDKGIGDCFRACMATLLELPIDVLPNDHSPACYSVWHTFLSQFGLSLKSGSAKDPIWCSEPWIATVKSKNFKGGLHAILMHQGGYVLFDPSTKKRYRKGERLVGSDVVTGGLQLVVSNVGDLHRLKEYQDKLKNENN